MQALRVRKDRKEVKVIMGWMGHLASGVARASRAPEAMQDLQALERKVKEVLPGNLGLSVLKAQVEFLVFLEHQVNQVLRVSVARQDHMGLKETEGLLDSKDLKVTLVIQAPEV